MPDVNMLLARTTGQHLGIAASIPLSLQGRTLREATMKRAALIDQIGDTLTSEFDTAQRQLPQGSTDLLQWGGLLVPKLISRLPNNNELAEITRSLMPDVPDLIVRLSIALRLWAGYMDTAKAIAPNTADGPTPRDKREDWFLHVIHPAAETYPVYAAGVVAAPSLKHRIKNEPIIRDGIPADSIVFLDWDD